MRAKVLVVAINKGGSTKTTLAFHIAHRAAEPGCRTLAADLDPQGSFTTMLIGHEWQKLPESEGPRRACDLHRPMLVPVV